MRLNKTKYSIFFLTGSLAVLSSASAQSLPNKLYRIKVLDELSQPISDAVLILKKNQVRYQTDSSGFASLNANVGDSIIIERVDYNFLRTVIPQNDNPIFVLKGAKDAGNEVVVTATGVKKELKKLGYATQTISGSQFITAREGNPLNALKGNVAGLTINVNPEIGHAPSVILRGEGAPMYVVDGIPMTSDTYNISADDIESYTVLKGPNATALYGFAGQNGAIIITTKKGTATKGKFVVNFNSSLQWNGGFLAIPKVQNEYGAGEYGTYAFGDGKGGGVNDYDYDGGWGPKMDGHLLPQYDGEYDANQTYTTTFENGLTYTGHIKPTPWVARGKNNLNNFLQTGLLNVTNVSISSSTDKTDFRASFGNSYQKGIVPNTSLNNFNFATSLTNRFTDKLNLSTYINYNRQSTPNLPDVNYGPNSLIYNLVLWTGSDWDVRDMRDYWVKGEEGVQQKFVENFRYNNPYFMSYEWLRGHYVNNIYGYTVLTYKPSNSLQFLIRPSINSYDFLNTEKVPYSASTYRTFKYGDYREDQRHLFQSNVEFQGSYTRRNLANFLDLNALVGANYRDFGFNSSYTTTDYLNVPNVYAFSNSMNPVKATSFRSNMKVLSAYYSLDLGYRSYLTLNMTGRADRSSSLPSNSNTYFYPSFNAATVLSDYIKMPSFISFFKLRGSYATSKSGGTSSFYSPDITNLPGSEYGYAFQSPYDGPSYAFNYFYSQSPTYNNVSSASYTDNLINPMINTSSRKSTEFGADIRFLHNRINLDVTRYHYVNEGIIQKTISSASGYSSYLTNGNKYKNDGWEVTLNATPLKSSTGLNWNVTANWSTFKRVWINNSSPDNYSHNGTRYDLVYNNAFVRTPDGKLVHDANSGLLLRYSDLGVSAKKVFGHSDPNWQWGIVNNFSYKNFSLRFQFDGMVGGVMADYVRQKSLQGGRHIETDQGAFAAARPNDAKVSSSYAGSYVGDGVVLTGGNIVLDPVTGQITNYSSLTSSANTTPTSVQGYVTRMASIPDLSTINKTFAKLREVTLSYNVPASFISKQHVFSHASISIVGRNLIYFFPSRYKDVDVDQYTQSTSSSLQTPTTRSYGVNLNLTF